MNKEHTPFYHILRIYIPEYAFESSIKDILAYCQQTGCKEVLLFTSSYDMEPSFKAIDEIKSYTEKILKPVAIQLRRADISVSVNIMQTLGHVYFPYELQGEFPFQRRVLADGKISSAGGCPLCKNLQQWVAQSYSIYSELKPRVLLIDDDFRTKMEQLSCFCDLHLDKISNIYGEKVSRQEVIDALFNDEWPPSELRKIYFGVTTQGFAKLARIIRNAVKRVSPQTRLGVMTARWPIGIAGIDWDIVLKALSDDEVPIVRPQISAYSENNIRDLPGIFMNPDCFRSVLPEKVEFWPEIENYPFTGYSKSARVTIAQMFIQIMNGFNHHALNFFDFFDQPFCEDENLIKMLVRRKVLFDVLVSLIPEGTKPYGIKIYVHKDALLVKRSRDEWLGGHNLANFIPNLGMPVTYSRNSDWQLLCGDDILAFADSEIDEILSGGALMDATAAEALALRGYSERIGVRVGEYIPFEELGYEEFLWPKVPEKSCRKCFPLHPFLGSKPDWRSLIPLKGTYIVASAIKNYRGQQSGTGMLLTENNHGERFAILGFSQNSSRRFMENRLRADQLRHSIEWIARKPLPVAVNSMTPYLWPVINKTITNKLIIGILNLSTDKVEIIPLISDKSISWMDMVQLNINGKSVPIDVQKVEDFGDSALWNISYCLEPLEFVVFRQK